MAKSTRIEFTPDDPIFAEGPQVFVPVSRPLTKTAAQEDPMKEAREVLEAALMELASDDLETTESATLRSKDKN